jgi:para-nitrobenzyl esterase
MEVLAMKGIEKTKMLRERRRLASRLLLAALTVCMVMLGATLNASADFAPFAITESGFLTGTTTNGVNEFLGIPYAKPPVGALRWLPPKPYGFFKGGFLKANTFGSECTQGGGGSENCLFLNVYTPQNVLLEDLLQDHGRGLPVMVWIHGGSLTSGAGSIYDPSQLVKKGVIVVTINYRLGLLGFFADSAIDAEGHENGNYGMMDQQFALNWVQRNIAGFGGDPRRVTIFGESAGGQSVYVQLASPTAKGLFHGAISESGSYASFADYLENIIPLAQGETTGDAQVPAGDTIASDLGCSTSACLRALPAASVIAENAGTIYPFVDGTLLTQAPGAAFASGEFNQVPVISGTNHDEWRIFVAEETDGGAELANLADYDFAVTALWTSALAPIVEILYPDGPPANDVNGPEALGASGTDGIFACPARTADQSLSQFVPTYTYEFNDENAPSVPFPGLTFPLGAYHGSELSYLFVLDGTPAPFTPAQQQLSAAMTTYWTQFAKNLNPNSPTLATWAPYNSATDEFQSFIPPTPVVESTFNTEHNCTLLWDVIPPI